MGLLDDAVGSAVPGGNVAKPLLIALGALLASGVLFKSGQGQVASAKPNPQQQSSTPPQEEVDHGGGLLGGLGGLLDRFQKGGQEPAINSWIGNGPNQPVSPGQLGSTLGPDIIKILAQKSGMSEEDLTRQLSQILPGVVDKLTPRGRIPTLSEIAGP
jgi:uncharacterized protein YidB (DUF937 family)